MSAGVFVLRGDAPFLADGLQRTGWPLVVVSGVCGGLALLLLQRGAPAGTRLLAIGAVVAVVWGWGVAQYPDILPGALSLADAAAPAAALDALLVVFILAGLLIIPSLVLLFTLDQRSRLEGHGLGSDVH